MSDVIEVGEVPERFERWLAGRPLAERSRREYARNVRAYCAWLAATPDRDGWQGDPLSDPLARDHAARDYRRHLQVERRAAPSTVNLALASLDALYRCLGLGRPNVRREKPAQAAPRALEEDAQRRLLRAAEGAPVRARALVMLMLFTALRISETVALDVDDVRITTRKGVLVVMGKCELRREVPLNALVRQVLDEWLEHRQTLAADGERALWVSRAGGRLSARSADRDVRAVAARAGLELSAHTLRHTCLTGLVRRGNDLVMVAELAGHQKLDTTRRYTLPSAADRQAAVEDLQMVLDGQLASTYAYSFIVCDIPVGEKTTTEVEHYHRQRAQIEERFKDAKLGQPLRHLPSGNLDANRLWLACCLLALNITAIVCDLSPAAAAGITPTAHADPATSGPDNADPDSDLPQRRHAKTLRRILFCVPARLTRSGRRAILHLAQGFAHLELFAATYHAALALPGP